MPAVKRGGELIVNSEGNTNRSGIHSLIFKFRKPHTVIGSESLLLVNRSTGTVVSVSTAIVSGNGTKQIVWTFVDDLEDGLYLASLPSDQITPSNRDKAWTFHKLAGDVDGDGFVNFNDFFAVDQYFNQMGDPYRSGDATGDGEVDAEDYNEVDENFNKSVS